MHELSIASYIIESVESSIPPGTEVKTIRLQIGKLSNVLPEALTFSFDIIKEETLLKNAVMEIEVKDVIVKCNQCGNESISDPPFIHCSLCGSFDVAVCSGEQLEITEIEIES
ncbi:MAG: hydrogenase maturation nickel metallochaperone HypA [Ignavibacteria bacterium]